MLADVYAMGNFTNRDDAGELVPIAQHTWDPIHEMVLLWLASEQCKPFDVREMLWDVDMREEELLEGFRL